MKRKDPKYKYGAVMLLDDNELDNFINAKMIEATNFSGRVYINTDGKSALEFLQNLSVAAANSYHIYPELIFVDLNMPLLDGFQFINILLEESKMKKRIPRFVILTSSVCDEDRIRAEKISKEIVFLHKPLTEAMLSNL